MTTNVHDITARIKARADKTREDKQLATFRAVARVLADEGWPNVEIMHVLDAVHASLKRLNAKARLAPS